MSSYASIVKLHIQNEPENKLFEASRMYQDYFRSIPEMSYYKALERLCKQGELVHLTKGLYYRPKHSRFGPVPISEDEIVKHYTEDLKGLVIGYKLYNQKGLTTQISRRVEVLSNSLPDKKKNISNVSVTNIDFPLTKKAIPVIETLEILQNYSRIEDVNSKALSKYMENFADSYSDEMAISVLEKLSYKKSTIAFLKSFLDFLGVENTLQRFLSALSKYEIPGMEEFYESARA